MGKLSERDWLEVGVMVKESRERNPVSWQRASCTVTRVCLVPDFLGRFWPRNTHV